MTVIFNSFYAAIAQHVAVPIEILAIYILWRDYRVYRSDYDATESGIWAELGELAIQPDRSTRFVHGIRLAMIAFILEFYQLISLWVGN